MNGDDSFDWAKKPAVPDNRKRAVSKKTIERLSSGKYCKKCAAQGIVSSVHLFQINDEEALPMCKNRDCTYMPSSNWESLIVKRSIFALSSKKKKRSLSSASSQLSVQSDKFTQSRLKRTTKSVSQSSRCNTSALVSSSQSLRNLPQQNLPGVAVSSSSLPAKRFLTLPAPPRDFSSEGKERKTLVPIAPFLSGHAHSFSSFDTNKLQHKFQQRGTFVHKVQSLVTQSNPRSELHPAPIVGSKQRACSLDSDSLSSGSSSLDSRPTTPVSDASHTRKKVRSIIVPPETLSKLLDGSMKLEIRKSDKSGADVIFRSVRKTGNTNSYFRNSEEAPSTYSRVKASGSVSGDSVRSESSVSSLTNIQDSVSGCGNLEITPVGSLNEIVGSRQSAFSLPSESASSDSVQSHIEAINFHLQADSIKTHVEAINSHIQAINKAVGCVDICAPLDFTNLCRKFSSEIEIERTKLQACGEGQWIGTADLRSEPSDVGMSSSQNIGDSFIPVGYFEKQVVGPVEISLKSDSSLSTSLDSEGFVEPIGS